MYEDQIQMMYQVSYEMDQLIGDTDDGSYDDDDTDVGGCRDHADDVDVADQTSSIGHDDKTDTCQKLEIWEESYPFVSSCPVP